ncbi:MAG: cytochrome c3 family protein [Actinomycetes bacterium]
MSDPEAVVGDDVEATTDTDSVGEDSTPRRPWYGLLVVILLLLLLLCCGTTTADVIITRGPEQARFVARNLTCLQCHTELIPDFSKPVVHRPFALKECTICHTPHGRQVTSIVNQGAGNSVQRFRTLLQWLPLRMWFTAWENLSGGSSSTSVVTSSEGTVISKTTKDVAGQKSMLTMPADKLCWTCHGSMGALLDDQFQHKPFAAGQCLNCHTPHASEYKGLISQAPDKLCFTCHPIGSEINRAQAHPPAKEGWCIDCHSPHASNNKGILIARQRELCFSCHPGVAGLADMPVQHQPFLGDNCTGCHEPHGSDYSPLLVNQQPELCYNCHPQISNQFSEPSHHPIGVQLACGSCHSPHAAQYAGLVDAQDNEFCYQCHGDKAVLYEGSAHRGQLCIKCHTPHGSAYAPILVAQNPALCLKCHPTLVGDNKHPADQKFFDVHAKKGLTCTSSCHNPHGTNQQYMLRSFDFWQDGLCLQCHKFVGIYY